MTLKMPNAYELTDEDWAGIDQLVAEKYEDGNGTMAVHHDMNTIEMSAFSCGTIDIIIEHNRIAACRIYGDFFGQVTFTMLKNI